MAKKKAKHLKNFFVGLLVVILTVAGLTLIFNEQIKTFIVNRMTTTALNQPIKKQQGTKKGNFDYDSVKAVDTKDVVNAATSDASDSIGKIAIPKVGIRLPIFYGLSQNNLMRGAGTMKQDEQMGETGNYALAGHHMENEKILFGPLENIQKGDKIYVTNGQNVYTYKVTQKVIVNQTQVQWLDNVPNQKLITLVTCSSGQEGVQTRIIVRGELVATQNATKKSLKVFNE